MTILISAPEGRTLGRAEAFALFGGDEPAMNELAEMESCCLPVLGCYEPPHFCGGALTLEEDCASMNQVTRPASWGNREHKKCIKLQGIIRETEACIDSEDEGDVYTCAWHSTCVWNPDEELPHGGSCDGAENSEPREVPNLCNDDDDCELIFF